VIVNEGNQFVWPGYDLRKVPGRDEFHYGFLPPRFFDQILAAARAYRKHRRMTMMPTVRILKGATVSLNGKYLMEVELTRSEIARLFYLTHSDVRELPDIIEMFASFKDDDFPIRLSYKPRDVPPDSDTSAA